MADSKELADVKLFKAALEFAKFDPPDVREALINAINALHLDLDELGFEPSTETITMFEALETAMEEGEEEESSPTSTPEEVADEADEDDDMDQFIEEVDDDDDGAQ